MIFARKTAVKCYLKKKNRSPQAAAAEAPAGPVRQFVRVHEQHEGRRRVYERALGRGVPDAPVPEDTPYEYAPRAAFATPGA